VAILAFASSSAGASHLSAPSAGAVVSPGELVEIRWSAPGRDVDELEILLILGDQARQALRLTPQLNPTTSSYLWTVPNLPATNARLVLRVGRKGHEEEDEPGPPFHIAGSDRSPLETLGFINGEWWARGHHRTPIAPSGMTAPLQFITFFSGEFSAIMPETIDIGGAADQHRSLGTTDHRLRLRTPFSLEPEARLPRDFPLRP
jgi:hypothetical protein